MIFNAFSHLLPNAKAWRLSKNKRLTQFFEGLSNALEDFRAFFDDLWFDIFPETTRQLDEWEQQFALPNTGLSEQARRDRLTATWRAQGGQDPDYIQTVLRDAGFDVYVHEWWEPVAGRSGGSVNGDVTPVVRDPFLYLWDGVSARQFVGCGHDSMMCGGDDAFVGSQLDPPGYPLVNRILQNTTRSIGCGSDLMFCGGDSAQAGSAEITLAQPRQYSIPPDPDKYPYFLYIGGQTFPDVAEIPASRQTEFEDLCLKIAPLEQWLGMLVTYS